MTMKMVPGQGFYKGSDFDEKQKKYLIQKEKKFAASIARFNLMPLDVVIQDIQHKINEYDDVEGIKDLAKVVSEYFCFTPSESENKQLLRL